MATAKISKHADAPEGDVKVSVGSDHFKVSDDKPYETDNPALIEYSQADPFLEVEITEEEDEAAVAREEAKDLRELDKARAAADKQRAEKDPLEAPAPKPSTVAELRELQDADDKEGSK